MKLSMKNSSKTELILKSYESVTYFEFSIITWRSFGGDFFHAKTLCKPFQNTFIFLIISISPTEKYWLNQCVEFEAELYICLTNGRQECVQGNVKMFTILIMQKSPLISTNIIIKKIK